MRRVWNTLYNKRKVELVNHRCVFCLHVNLTSVINQIIVTSHKATCSVV